MFQNIRQFFISTFCIVFLLSACAQIQPGNLNPNIYDPLESQAQTLKAWKRFNKKYGSKLRVKWNPNTGTPHRISGNSIHIRKKLTRENIEAVTRRLIAEHETVFRVDPKNLSLSKVEFYPSKRPDASAGTWYVYYRQTYRNLPVRGGSVRLIIRNQRVTTIGVDYYPDINVSVEPRVPLALATKTVQTDLKTTSTFEPLNSKLIIFPKVLSEKVHYLLAWQITMPITEVPKVLKYPSGMAPPSAKKENEMKPVQWRYFVDAHTGQFERINVLANDNVTGNVSGMVHPLNPTDPPVSRPISSMTLTANQGGTTTPSETNSDGDYTISGLATSTTNIEAQLKGPHVIIDNEETEDPDATHTATITVPGTHSWNWDADDLSQGDGETNTFYHVNWMRNWFLNIDPQLSNPNPYPMTVGVRSVILGMNCNASAGASGLSFGKGEPGFCEDFGLCADVIYHEYTHRVVQSVYDENNVVLPYSGFTGAMNEGWADYFSSTATQDPNQLEVCLPSLSRNIDTPDKRFPEDWVDEVHSDGTIFSGAIWDTRTALGSAYVDEMTLRAMKHAATDFNEYLGAILEEDDDPAFSMDSSANNDPLDGTPNADAICSAFYDLHGIYHSFCENKTTQAVAIITEPSPISSFNLYNSTITTIPIIGSVAGSSTSPLQNYVLEYASATNPDTWISFGTGTVAVGDDALGQLDISDPGVMPNGVYFIRLTANTLDTPVAASAIVSLVIDRHIMSGWPKGTDLYSIIFKFPILFLASPAIADVDPSYPGLEVVAGGWGKSQLYVLRSDGTAAAGNWPQKPGTIIASPAVGDLDGDGTLEIVVHTYNGQVIAYNNDGSKVSDLWPAITHIDMFNANQWSTPALADLDEDGDLEIVVGSTDHQVYAWHHDGSPVANWPVTVNAKVESSPALGNVDGVDGNEVVINSNDGTVYVLNGSGTKIAEWSIPDTVVYTSSPVLGDLDGDGDLEILIGAGEPLNFKVYAWNHDGTPAAGNWPQVFPSSYMERPGSLSLANLEGDSGLEVLARARNGNVYAWDSTGTPLSGWPPDDLDIKSWEENNSSTSVADLDGDGNRDVLADAGSTTLHGYTHYDISAFHANGAPVDGWPKTVTANFNSTPGIADIDLDGDPEVVIGSHGLFIWDLPASTSPGTNGWPLYRHDNRRTGTYADTIPPIISLLGPADVTVEACSVYSVPKATALDDVDGDLTNSIEVDFNNVNMQVPGEYNITYDVSDSAGNAAIQRTQTVDVVDTTPPDIVLLGPPEITLPLGSTYKDPGAIAKDCVDGEIAPAAGSDLDVHIPGTYIVTYFSVSDSAGNASAQKTRTVHVLEQ